MRKRLFGKEHTKIIQTIWENSVRRTVDCPERVGNNVQDYLFELKFRKSLPKNYHGR